MWVYGRYQIVTLEYSTQTTAAAFGAYHSALHAADSFSLLALSSHQFHSKLKTFLFEQFFSP